MSRAKIEFTPYAWAKLRYLRQHSKTEVGGFGVAAGETALVVTDIRLVKQQCSVASVSFDDQSVANFFDDMVDAGLHPTQFGRIWIHTHPGSSPHPSSTDEDTFKNCFGKADWSVMFIMAEGSCCARLNISAPFRLQTDIDYAVDYDTVFPASDHAAWDEELKLNVSEKKFVSATTFSYRKPGVVDEDELARYRRRFITYAGLPDSTPGCSAIDDSDLLVFPPANVDKPEKASELVIPPSIHGYQPKKGDKAWHTLYGECEINHVHSSGDTVDATGLDGTLLCSIPVAELIVLDTSELQELLA